MQKEYPFEGTHIVCDIHEIKKVDLLTNQKALEEILVNAAKKSKTRVVDVHTPSYFIGKGGLTVYVTVRESSFTFHGYPETQSAFVDCFSCGSIADPKKGLSYIVKQLDAKIANPIQIKRGNVKNLEISAISKKSRKDAVPFIFHHLIDAYDCNRKKLNDMDITYDFLDSLPEMLNYEKISTPYVWKKRDGLVGEIELSENNKAGINTSVTKALIIFDLILTKKINVDPIKEKITQLYKAKDMDDQLLWRGIDT